jgi:hypothetical protein
MNEALGYFRTYEPWIYASLSIWAFWQFWKFGLAWQALRNAAFGLEREQYQARLNAAASWLVIILFMVVTEFVLVSFVIPTIPEANPLPTPTLDLLATPTTTLPPPTNNSSTPGAAATLPPLISAIEGSSCISETVNITSPIDGEQVKDVVTLKGTANLPNFGFYKYEVARPGDLAWLSLNAGRERVINNKLGDWDTTTVPPGDYVLRLVVTDNAGVAQPPCIIRVRVLAPASESP